MPRFDGRGPQGAGKMTGRGMGNWRNPESDSHGVSGCQFGTGRRRGFRRCAAGDQLPISDELSSLKKKIDAFEQRLKKDPH